MTTKEKKWMLPFLLILFLLITGCASEKTESPGTPGTTTNEESPSTPEGEGENEESPSPSEDAPVVFSNSFFEEKIKEELGKDTVLQKDLDTITGFAVSADEFIFLWGEGRSQKSIIHFYEDEFEYEGVRYKGYGTLTSLEDLKHFKNLKTLAITLQPDIDYATLPEEVLKNLTTLWIYQSKVSDISFLTKAENLGVLRVNTNNVTDLTPVKDLKNLKRLIVDWNAVEDLTPLTGLTGLIEFSAYGNKIKDLSPLSGLTNLETLSLYDNEVENLEPLTTLTNLKELELISNNIKDVSPLKDFTSFESLRLNGNPIENIELLSHIEALEFQP